MPAKKKPAAPAPIRTAHQLARVLRAGPDLRIYHFDPSRAGLDEETDTSLSVVTLAVENPRRGLTKRQLRDFEAEGYSLKDFITLAGNTSEEGEAMSNSESDIRSEVRLAITNIDRLTKGKQYRNFRRTSAGRMLKVMRKKLHAALGDRG